MKRLALLLLLAAGAALTTAAAVDPAPAFDPASVPESSATLPPFPFFETPEGLVSIVDERERAADFDREHMIAGDAVIALEGKIARDRFLLEPKSARRYSAIEFHRLYADAVAALGGIEVSRVQYTPAVTDAFGGRAAVDRHYHGACASHGCENHTYLLRQGGREWWVQVSSGGIPLHGEVVVLEKQGPASKLGFIGAAAMQQALDADGRIALHIPFDTDRATLRPDAAPILDEILALLRANPALALHVDGHTDGTGTPAHNQALSERRADAVVAALVADGIDGARLQARGFGATRPLVEETGDAERARNRRVELVKRE